MTACPRCHHTHVTGDAVALSRFAGITSYRTPDGEVHATREEAQEWLCGQRGARVDPDWILAQRAAGWPDMHPEDYCHRCGVRNPLWFTDAETWAIATAAWAAETGREGICCPGCLAQMHEAATGRPAIWSFSVSIVGDAK